MSRDTAVSVGMPVPDGTTMAVGTTMSEETALS
jgi:hypothetical protein